MSAIGGSLPDELESLLSRSATKVICRRGSDGNPGRISAPQRPYVDQSIGTQASSTTSPRSLSLLNGVALVVGLQIGSGIFSSPSAVVHDINSPIVATWVWLVAGLLVWTGASCSAELATNIPVNGGTQEYLRFCYHDSCGFVASLVWILVVKPSSLAMIAIIFAEYLHGLYSSNSGSTLELNIIAILALSMLTYVNCLGTSVSATSATIFLALKLIGLISIILTGLLMFMINPRLKDEDLASRGQLESHHTSLRSLSDSLFAALWSYSGWETVGIVAGELKDPLKNIPRVINVSMMVVIPLFILANLSYFVVLPLSVVQESNSVALAFGERVFGQAGRSFYAIIICTSCMGALNVKLFSTGRLVQAAAARNYVPRFLSRMSSSWYFPLQNFSTSSFGGNPVESGTGMEQLHEYRKLPRNAMMLTLILASAYVFFGSFRSLIILNGLAEYSMCLTSTAGVLVLRFKAQIPEAITERSATYQTFWINPILFCTATAFILLRSAVGHPTLGLSLLIFYASLGTIYFLRQAWFNVEKVETAGQEGIVQD